MRVVLGLIAALLVLPAAASAAEVKVVGGVLTVTAAPGEVNHVVIGFWPGQSLRVTDTAPMTAGAGCAPEETSWSAGRWA